MTFGSDRRTGGRWRYGQAHDFSDARKRLHLACTENLNEGAHQHHRSIKPGEQAGIGRRRPGAVDGSNHPGRDRRDGALRSARSPGGPRLRANFRSSYRFPPRRAPDWWALLDGTHKASGEEIIDNCDWDACNQAGRHHRAPEQTSPRTRKQKRDDDDDHSDEAPHNTSARSRAC